MVRKRAALSFFALPALMFLAAGCSPGKKLTADQIRRIDMNVQEAMNQYDEGNYNEAYRWTGLVLEMDPDDIHARLIRAWSLLQAGRYDPWINPDTETKHQLPGARQEFERVLQVSPNEFRARQGMAAIHFRSYYENSRKSELLERMAAEFGNLAEKARGLAEPGLANEERRRREDEFFARWKLVNDAYRIEATKPYALFTNPEDNNHPIRGEGWSTEDWVREELRLDEINYHVNPHRGAWLRAIQPLEYFVTASRNRAGFWENRAIIDLQAAKVQYEDLERTGSEYSLTKYDLALVHMALGEFFLRKALREAEADFRRQLPDVKLTDGERDEVIASFFADETRHRNPRRQVIRDCFRIAAQKMDEFIRADEEAGLRADETVERARVQFTSGQDQNAVVADFLGLYEREARAIQRERIERRKELILNQIVIYVFPQYLNQNLTQAKILTSRLRTTDLRDAIPHFIDGVIFEKQGELEDSISSYEKFLQTTGPGMYLNRRQWVRDRIHRLKYQLERERIEGRR